MILFHLMINTDMFYLKELQELITNKVMIGWMLLTIFVLLL